jgi:hypothetical protein
VRNWCAVSPHDADYEYVVRLQSGKKRLLMWPQDGKERKLMWPRQLVVKEIIPELRVKVTKICDSRPQPTRASSRLSLAAVRSKSES